MSTKSTPAAPATHKELTDMLRKNWSSLSPSQRRIAERILSDSEAVAFMTINELASSAGVNEATVVRFAGRLGFRGYPALQQLCQEYLRDQAQLLRRFENLEQLALTGGDLFERTASFDQANITRTFARIDQRTWESVVDALDTARRVHVMGQRKLHTPAYLLGYLLGMVREDVETVTGHVGMLPESLRRVEADDCFVAMAIHRYPADTVKATRWARKRGAHVVVLTDHPGSPLVSHAHDALYIEVASTGVMRSMTAFVSVVQALSTAVAQDPGTKTRDTLQQEEELLQSLGVYQSDDSESSS